MSRDTYTRRDFLKGLGAAALAIPGCMNAYQQLAGRPRKDKPNIIFILADDLGWTELGCYGNRFNETPNLDRMASQGILFTDAYAASPYCSPTRASFVTGQYAARVGINAWLAPWDPKHLSADQITIAEMLKRAGYATGIIGKWHLTGYANHGAEEVPPSQHGFDETIISENRGIGGGSYFYPYHFNREVKKRLPGKEYLIDRMNLEAVEFIERHKNRPFFLYYSHYAVHTQVHGKDELVAKYATEEVKAYPVESRKRKHNNPHLAAQLEVIDEGVGMIMKKLDKLGLAENTILVFFSDNGGSLSVTSNAPLRGGKGELYEGGIREPLIVYWPKVVKSGGVCTAPVVSCDFYPTFLEAADIEPDSRQHLDGISLLPVLEHPRADLKRNALYWYFPYKIGDRSPHGAVRMGSWKLIEFFDTGELELYNLAKDIGEKNNLADKYPKKVADLRKRLTAWQKDVRAEVPADWKLQRPRPPSTGPLRRETH